MSDKAPALLLDVSPRADTELASLTDWLNTLSSEAGQRLVSVFYTEVTALRNEFAEQIANSGRPAFLPDELASLAFSRPVFTRTFTTQKKRTRRSSSGTYQVLFALQDADGDDQVDTLSVLSIRHAAARPVWDMEDENA